MCDFGIVSGSLTAAMALAQGVASYQSGQANAAYAKAEGQAAQRAATLEAGRYAQKAAYDLGKDRAGAAASGFGAGTGTEALAAKASSYGLDIDSILYGGQVAKAQADHSAALSRQRGVGALLGGVVTAAGNVLSIPGIWESGAGAVNGGYGQMARYGTSRPMVGVGRRLIGGV